MDDKDDKNKPVEGGDLLGSIPLSPSVLLGESLSNGIVEAAEPSLLQEIPESMVEAAEPSLLQEIPESMVEATDSNIFEGAPIDSINSHESLNLANLSQVSDDVCPSSLIVDGNRGLSFLVQDNHENTLVVNNYDNQDLNIFSRDIPDHDMSRVFSASFDDVEAPLAEVTKLGYPDPMIDRSSDAVDTSNWEPTRVEMSASDLPSALFDSDIESPKAPDGEFVKVGSKLVAQKGKVHRDPIIMENDSVSDMEIDVTPGNYKVLKVEEK